MYNQLFIRLLNCSSSFDGRTRAPPCTGGGEPPCFCSFPVSLLLFSPRTFSLREGLPPNRDEWGAAHTHGRKGRERGIRERCFIVSKIQTSKVKKGGRCLKVMRIRNAVRKRCRITFARSIYLCVCKRPKTCGEFSGRNATFLSSFAFVRLALQDSSGTLFTKNERNYFHYVQGGEEGWVGGYITIQGLPFS